MSQFVSHLINFEIPVNSLFHRIAILKGNVQHPHAVGDSSGEDIVCDDDNDKEKNDSKADYLEDNEITLRASARSIEMECDSFSRPSRSVS